MTFTLRSQAPQQAEKLKAALIEAAKAEPLLRSKGFIHTGAAGDMLLVQGVRSRVTISADASTPPAQKSELVFIGYHPSRSRVAALLTEFTGTPWR
jgi:cobalamin biosynthesis protein CobW